MGGDGQAMFHCGSDNALDYGMEIQKPSSVRATCTAASAHQSTDLVRLEGGCRRRVRRWRGGAFHRARVGLVRAGGTGARGRPEDGVLRGGFDPRRRRGCGILGHAIHWRPALVLVLPDVHGWSWASNWGGLEPGVTTQAQMRADEPSKPSRRSGIRHHDLGVRGQQGAGRDGPHDCRPGHSSPTASSPTHSV